ncbi:MAG: hypothetical protein A2Y86_01775 [Candidatus Aminicenantes bacterium RBG_13_62_12]|nr:MAG: hypothetical protein A2Y86_01775 [Candidatus Aminicenantes bacterium RBG_13_62_12]
MVVIPAFLLAFCASLLAGNEDGGLKSDTLESILRRMKARLDFIEDYRCLYSSVAVRGPRREESVIKYFYKKPGRIRAEIVGGDKNGTILLTREGKVRVQTRGILSFASFTFRADNPRVTDIRGNKLEETSWEHLVDEHLRELDALELISARRETLDGREALVLEIASREPSRTRRIAREVLWVCAADDILLGFDMFDYKDRLVQAGRFADIILNPGLPDSLFTRFSRR